MTVALGILAMGKEALRDHKMEIVPGARHRHIEEPQLLLDLGRGAGAYVSGRSWYEPELRRLNACAHISVRMRAS